MSDDIHAQRDQFDIHARGKIRPWTFKAILASAAIALTNIAAALERIADAVEERRS